MAQGYLLFILTILSAPHYLQMFYLRVYFCGEKGLGVRVDGSRIELVYGLSQKRGSSEAENFSSSEGSSDLGQTLAFCGLCKWNKLGNGSSQGRPQLLLQRIRKISRNRKCLPGEQGVYTQVDNYCCKWFYTPFGVTKSGTINKGSSLPSTCFKV